MHPAPSPRARPQLRRPYPFTVQNPSIADSPLKQPPAGSILQTILVRFATSSKQASSNSTPQNSRPKLGPETVLCIPTAVPARPV